MSPARLPDFALEVYLSRWEFAASHHLTASDAETLTLQELLALGDDEQRVAWNELALGYVPTWGTAALREAVAATYRSVAPEDVLAFAGAGEALYWSLQLLLEAGDHAIVTVPNYQSIESVPVAEGVKVDGLPLWHGEGSSLEWTLDVDRVRSLLRPSTRVVAVNFPNNPTGFVPPEGDWLELVSLCEERGIRLLSDEVYRGLELDAERRIPQAADASPTALSVNVLSKAYGLPGLRVGWVACRDRALLARLERAKHYTSICNSGPAEHLAAIALQNAERILERNRRIVADNDALVRRFTGERADLFEYRTPVGGCVAFPRYLGDDGVEELCRRAVEEHGVFLLPASIYASGLAEVPSDRFRIGIGRRGVPAALEQLDRHLRERDAAQSTRA